MVPLQSHLSLLESSSSSRPNSPVFRIPQLNPSTSQVHSWLAVSYLQFRQDVELYASYWSSILAADGIPRRSVVGLWLGGMEYKDVLHIYGLSRAGYIPQLFSLRLPNPIVVFELLQEANARALIYEPSFGVDLSGSSVPVHAAVSAPRHGANFVDDLPDIFAIESESDTAFIFHTSGSTSGKPKLVPCSYRWLDAMVSKARYASQPKSSNRQDVTTWIGSMCHIAQTFMLIGSMCHGSCTVQPTSLTFSSDELKDMIQRCGLTRLNQFATFLATQLRNSRQDKKLLQMIIDLDEVCYTGLPLDNEEEAWAIQNGVSLKNMFGSTECNALLLSKGGQDQDAPLLSPIQGTSYGFFPISDSDDSLESTYQNSNGRLLELVILAESGDCPDQCLRHSDGHFHTGDLFVEVKPGCYAPRGRMDDWIKSENSLRCDTKSIEDNVRSTCSELIFECIVVGNGRPSPTLFVEPSEQCTMDPERLKKEIIRRTRHFHSRRYLHERITSTKFVVVLERRTLPRTATKGNVRRKAVEEQYKNQLDIIYGKV